MNAREIERLQAQVVSSVDLAARLDALEARVTALENPLPIPPPPPPPVEVEPIVMERGTPKRSSNRTVGKKR